MKKNSINKKKNSNMKKNSRINKKNSSINKKNSSINKKNSSINKKNSRQLLKGGGSAKPGTLNLKCPNMDCGTAGLPGFHPSWGKVGGYRTYLKYKKHSQPNKRVITKKKTTKRKTFNKKGGKGKIGPYLSIDNHFLPSYSRYGAPGSRQEWKGGINLN